MTDDRQPFVGPIRNGIVRFTSRPHLGPLSIRRATLIKHDCSIKSPIDGPHASLAEGISYLKLRSRFNLNIFCKL